MKEIFACLNNPPWLRRGSNSSRVRSPLRLRWATTSRRVSACSTRYCRTSGLTPSWRNSCLFTRLLLREDPQLLGYGVWLLIERESRTVVGSAGFQGRPSSEGEIELGYGIHADFQNLGYATEAARALSDGHPSSPR